MKHLPECPSTSTDPLAEDCCCPRLHACEQRVYQEQIAGRQHDMVLSYLRGLDAAREAVRDECSFLPTHLCSECERAVAAINALRESK